MSVIIRSHRARTVAGMFGISEDPKSEIPNLNSPPPIALPAGAVTLITGPSGAGKTTLLRELRRAHAARTWLDVGRIRLPGVPVVDCFQSDDLVAVLMTLGRVGLGEVWTYLRTPPELSEGQRWRLRLALALWQMRHKPGILVADEFCAVLDRITAKVVARCLRKSIDASPGLAAVVASAHEDLELALRPDLIVTCDFGQLLLRTP